MPGGKWGLEDKQGGRSHEEQGCKEAEHPQRTTR